MSPTVWSRVLQVTLSVSAIITLSGISQCNSNCVEYDADDNRTVFECVICDDFGADECSSGHWWMPGAEACAISNQPKQPDGTLCTNDDGAGMCSSGVCVVDVACGDGITNGTEACDDGTALNGTGEGFCLSDCSGTQLCADGIQNGTEFCEVTDVVDCTTLGFIGGTAGCNTSCEAWDESSCTMSADCGNGTQDPGEACDDGVNMGGEGNCLACTGVQTCGDGNSEGTETCDDGAANGTGNGFCLSDCTGTQTCGDDVQNGTEACDDGVLNGSGNDACLSDCSGTQTCGDGTANGTETCDDGVSNGTGDGFCLSDCTGTQSCGDGVKNGSEFCESSEFVDCTTLAGGFLGGDALCNASCEAWDASTCTTPADCGDAVQDPGEACDDGVNDGGEGQCLACAGIQTCGDGSSEGDEACDDGANNDSGDGFCVGDCSGTQSCGDGVQNGTEVCDDGTNDGGPNGCLPGCQAIQACGNGTQEGTESCDDGANNGTGDSFCLSDCSATQTCGDGVQNGTELCDLGDSELCTTIDPGFLGGTAICDASCTGWELSTCITPADCGNGIVDDGELCDDGVNDGGEGDCVACQAVQVCGDGTQNGTEQCDDGNTVENDGCGADCTTGLIACGFPGATCPPGGTCYPTGYVNAGNSDWCLLPGTLPEGSVCTAPDDCQPGIACVPVPADSVNLRCAALCDSGNPCADGSPCLALGTTSNLSACRLDVCDLFAQDCVAGAACYPLTVSDGTMSYADNFCWSEGSSVLGDPCTDHEQCVAGLGCGVINGAPAVCVEMCDLGNPACPAGTTCQATSSPDFGACVVDPVP